MAEPLASSSTAASYVMVGGISLASLFSGIDGSVLIGAFAGATLFVMKEQSLSLWRRFLYFIISIFVGYLVAPEVIRWTPLREPAAAALIASALVVTFVNRALEWFSAMNFGQIIEFISRLRGPKA